MRTLVLLFTLALLPGLCARAADDFDGGQSSGGGKLTDGGLFPNPRIDMDAYLTQANAAAEYRKDRLISEAEFSRMSKGRNTIILDARSAEKFKVLHVRGAINLSFPDITIDSLARTVPNTETRILIYCNNNFLSDENAFPAKRAEASLNLSTFIALYSYGYRNVYELGPLLDVKHTKIHLVSGE